MPPQPGLINTKQKLIPKLPPPSSFTAPPSTNPNKHMCTIAPSPGMPAFTHETPEEYKVRKRHWHNQTGRKYRSKLSDKFEGLQAMLVQTAFLNIDTVATTSRDLDADGDAVLSGELSSGEVLELIRRRQEEEEGRDDEDGEGEEEGDEDIEGCVGVEGGFAGAGGGKMGSGGSGSSVGGRRPRDRRSKTINKAKMLGMARKTILKFRAERDALLRDLEGGESE